MRGRVTHSLVRALRAVPELASLDDTTLLKIVGASTNLFWPAGKLVFETGSEADGLYIVLSGTVRILDVVNGENVEIARIPPGDFFGELSLMLDTTHTKNAQAMEDSELMVLPKESFQRLLALNPQLARDIQRKFEARLPKTMGANTRQ